MSGTVLITMHRTLNSNAKPVNSEIFACSAYIECSAKENRGLRHIVEEAVWILNSAAIASAADSITDTNNGVGGHSLNNATRKWSLSSSYPSKASPKHKSRYSEAEIRNVKISVSDPIRLGKFQNH